MNRSIITLALAAAAASVLSACVDRPGLFDPEEPLPINIALPAGEVAVHEMDTLSVSVRGDGTLQAQLLMLDSVGTVLWRSATVSVERGVATVAIQDVPGTVERGTTVFLTAVATDAGGARYYASDDSVAASRLVDAARRPGRVWAGMRLRTEAGYTPAALAADPEAGRAYYPVPGASAVGILDLGSTPARIVGSHAIAFRPGRVAYRAGVLAVLGESGGELAFVRGGVGAAAPPGLLPPLELELDTTLLAAVRPTGLGLTLGCADEACGDPYALVPSALQVLDGAVPNVTAASVLRVLPSGTAEPAPPALALPGFSSVLRGDTAAAATVFTPRSPDGTRAEVLRRDGVSVCLATSLGGALVAAGAPGVAYVASPGDGEPACGPGTRIVRLDGLGGGAGVALSALAVRNTQGDDRIAGIEELQVADGGGAVLARTRDAVLVLDPYLRVKGAVPLQSGRAISWLRGPGAGAGSFAVADETGIRIYDAERLTLLERVPVGPTQGPVAFLLNARGERVLAAPVAGGFVVATLPND